MNSQFCYSVCNVQRSGGKESKGGLQNYLHYLRYLSNFICNLLYFIVTYLSNAKVPLEMNSI